MKFTPKEDSEIKTFGLLPEGPANFVVAEAMEKYSKGGNEMIEMDLTCSSGTLTNTVKFYMLEKMAHTHKHFHRATGMMDKYQSGETTADDCVGKTGKVVLGIEKGKQKDDGSYFYDKNVVVDFLWDESKPAAELEGQADVIDAYGDLPF